MERSKRLYIVGAGFAGSSLANEIKSKAFFGKVVAFLDDDPEKIGKKIDGIPVLELLMMWRFFLGQIRQMKQL